MSSPRTMPLGGVAHAAGRQQGHVVGGGADDRIGLDIAAARLGKGPDLVDVGRGMDAGEPAAVDRLELEAAALGCQPRLLQADRSMAEYGRHFRGGRPSRGSENGGRCRAGSYQLLYAPAQGQGGEASPEVQRRQATARAARQSLSLARGSHHTTLPNYISRHNLTGLPRHG